MPVSPSEATLIVGATPRRRRWQIDKTVIIAYAFIAPAVFGFLIFYLLPTFRAIYISFTDWNLLRIPKVVGLANYDRLMHDKNFLGLDVDYPFVCHLQHPPTIGVRFGPRCPSAEDQQIGHFSLFVSRAVSALQRHRGHALVLDPGPHPWFRKRCPGMVWDRSYRVLQRSEPGFGDDRGGQHLATHRLHGVAVLYRASEYSA